jgi:hypothetical protein
MYQIVTEEIVATIEDEALTVVKKVEAVVIDGIAELINTI